jgi:putative redox protein
MATIQVFLQQTSATATQGVVRDKHKIMIDRPQAKGGTDEGAMGGELLLVALGGCFMSNLLEVIRTRGADVHEVTLTIDGTLESAPSRFSAVTLNLRARYHDDELMQKLVTMAERACIVANTLRPAVALTWTIARHEG